MRRRLLALLPAGLLLLPSPAGAGLPLPSSLANLALARLLPEGLSLRLGSLRTDGHSYLSAGKLVLRAGRGQSGPPLLSLEELRLEGDLWPVLSGRRPWSGSLRKASLKGLRILLRRGRDGRWNLGSLLDTAAPSAASPAPAPLALSAAAPPLATRLELSDGRLVLEEEGGARTSVEGLRGYLDTRDPRRLSFDLGGRSAGRSEENLQLAGDYEAAGGAASLRLRLRGVELARSLNYLLPPRGLRFTGGEASLDLALVRARRGAEPVLRGGAEVSGGVLSVPGVAAPVSRLEGGLAFDGPRLRFRGLKARFLDSDWVASGSLSDFLREEPRFDLDISNPSLPLDSLSRQVAGLGLLRLSGTAAVQARLQGAIRQAEVDARVEAPWAGLAGLELGRLKASARLKGSRLELRDLEAALWSGRLSGAAKLGLEPRGEMEADLALVGARLEQLRLEGRRPLPLGGRADLDFHSRGSRRAPELELGLKLREASLAGQKLGDLDLDLRRSAGEMKGQLRSADGRLGGSLDLALQPAPLLRRGSLSLRQLDLEAAARALAAAEGAALPAGLLRSAALLRGRLSGLLDLSLSAEGPLEAPKLRLQAALAQGRLRGLGGLRDEARGLELKLEGGELLYRAGSLDLGRPGLPLKLRLGPRKQALELQALGSLALGAAAPPGKAELELRGDLGLLNAWRRFRGARGQLKGRLSLQGSLEQPSLGGELSLSEGALEPDAYLAPLAEANLRARFSGQRGELEGSFRCGGQLQARGGLDLSAGLADSEGWLELRSDEEGLRFQGWEGWGRGNLAMDPFSLRWAPGEPLELGGKLRLSNALLTYSGRRSASPGPAQPLELDLKLGLGSNVWYERRQEAQLDADNILKLANEELGAAVDTLSRPDIYFRLRPTESDILIKGGGSELELRGELAIDRGRVTIMENDFDFAPDKGPQRISLHGRRGDLYATALARLRYSREDGLTRLPRQRVVNAVASVRPLDPEELARSNLADSFLNYRVDFDTDPAIVKGDAALQRTAAVNLVILGDPVVDLGAAGADSGAPQDPFGAVGQVQLSRVASGFVRKHLASLLRKARVLGNSWVDVRVTPRIRTQLGAAAAAGPAGPARPGPGADIDWTLEVGKSLGDKLYSSLQVVSFSEATKEAALVPGQSKDVVRNGGFRTGLEFQVGPSRSLEFFYNYSVDDNLEPVAFDPANLWLAHSFVGRLRNTIALDSYSTVQARRRRWDGEAEGEEGP